MSPVGIIIAYLKTRDFASQKWTFFCPYCADRTEQDQAYLIYNRERLKEVARLFGRDVAKCAGCQRDLIGEDRDSRSTRRADSEP